MAHFRFVGATQMIAKVRSGRMSEIRNEKVALESDPIQSNELEGEI